MPRRSMFKACRTCGALVKKDAAVCPVCGGSSFSDDWDGIVIILDPKESYVARILGREKAYIYAIRVGGYMG